MNKYGKGLSIGCIGFGILMIMPQAIWFISGLIDKYTGVYENLDINIIYYLLLLISLIVSCIIIYGCWTYRKSQRFFQWGYRIGLIFILFYSYMSWYSYSRFPDEPGWGNLFYALGIVFMFSGLLASFSIFVGAFIGYWTVACGEQNLDLQSD